MEYIDLFFPEGFLWGSAAAAHQTEGGNHNNWSEWEKIPGKIKDGTNADVACDHYNRYEEDFDLAKELGHQVHRFSIEWSRIEPSFGKWDYTQIVHYKKVIESLVKRGIQPMVTLHHFTNPVWFAENGDWLNPESPELFGRYCRKIVQELSNYDVIWNTINEPMVVVTIGYLWGDFPPGHNDFGKAIQAAKHLLMAHGQASTQIREVYSEKGLDQPKIAPVLSTSYIMPENPEDPEDLELAEYIDNLYNHLWIESAITGRILNPMGDGQRYAPLENSVDFIGVNYYSRMVVSSKRDFMAGEIAPKDPYRVRCEGLEWEFYPEGYYHQIMDYWKKYQKPIFLTENGIGTSDDRIRQRYIISHLQQVHKAIQDGAKVDGYLVWSLTDNFEWAQGFSSHFGIIECDFDTLKRKPRESAFMLRKIIKDNGLVKETQETYLA
ncbi:MAG: family 1 glycosylhydrolase [Candidatus Lokiarchaeota archaeon]|nr:family 1 glycosylhydrolase [Candidatus Lokiarchaeota archaeon]